MVNLALESLPSPKTYSQITKDIFASQVVPRHEPVVFKGFARQWPMVKLAKENSAQVSKYLASHAAAKSFPLVQLAEQHKGRLFYNEQFTGMNFNLSQQKLSDGIARMTDNPEQRFCYQCVPVEQGFPELVSTMTNPLIPADTARFIWFGETFSVAPHFDEADNIAVVACGKRRFTLFPPEQVANLYIGPLDHTPAGQPISLVDINNPDLERYPRYLEAYHHAISVELEPGDAIYIPSPWWHQVNSLSPFNVLVNYWWSDARVASALPLPMLGHVLQAVSALRAPQKASWKALIEHFVFGDEDDIVGHIPEHARGVLGELDEKDIQRLHSWLRQTVQ